MHWNLLAIGVGGCVGAVSRFYVSHQVQMWFGHHFPHGTLVVNALGSLVLGFLFIWFRAQDPVPGLLQAAMTVGFLGAFTTFSTFSVETVLLMSQEQWSKAFVNIVFNVMICLALSFAGMRLAKWLLVN